MNPRRISWVVAFALFMCATPSQAERRYFVDAIDVDASVSSDGALNIEVNRAGVVARTE